MSFHHAGIPCCLLSKYFHSHWNYYLIDSGKEIGFCFALLFWLGIKPPSPVFFLTESKRETRRWPASSPLLKTQQICQEKKQSVNKRVVSIMSKTFIWGEGNTLPHSPRHDTHLVVWILNGFAELFIGVLKNGLSRQAGGCQMTAEILWRVRISTCTTLDYFPFILLQVCTFFHLKKKSNILSGI